MLEAPNISPNKIEEYMTECLIENGLDPGLIENRKKDARRPTVEAENCYLACMDKKLGWMLPNGTYDEVLILSEAQTPELRAEMKKKYDDVMKKCQAEAGDNFCKFAGCINKQPRNFYL